MNELVKSVFEKIVISLVVAILSTVVLLGYNSYNKIFEAAQNDARPLSTLFVSLRKEILEASLQSVKSVRLAYSNNATKLVHNDPEVKKFRNKAAEIIRLSALFKGRAGGAYESGTAVGKKIQQWLTIFETNLDEDRLDRFDKEVTEATQTFLDSYQNEYSAVVAGEFKKFFDGYYSSVPIYANPTWLLIFATVSLIFSIGLVAYFGMLKEEKSDAPPGRDEEPSSTRLSLLIVEQRPQ